MLKKLFLLIGVYFLFAPTYALANDCLDSLKASDSTCRQSYDYDVFVMYFKDDNNEEHKVHAKRVFEKSTGKFVHVDYDFISNCTNDCSSLDSKVNDILWSFRNAYIADKLYAKVIYKCDPTEENCCYDAQFNEIPDIGNPLVNSSSALEEVNNSSDNLSAQQNGAKQKDGDLIDKAISRTNGAISIVDRIMRDSDNGQEVKQKMENVTAQPSLFQIVNTVSGAVKVCAVSGAYCNEIAGSATASKNMANFDLHHNNGSNFNRNLHNFLVDVYEIDYGLSCNQTVTWHGDGSVTIKLRCIRY